MPSPASHGANAAIVQGLANSPQIGHAGRSNGIEDRHRVRGEPPGLGGLSVPPDRTCFTPSASVS
jgi:hypothetical protein